MSEVKLRGYTLNHIRNYIKQLGLREMNECLVCKKPDHEKPMAFRNKPWCSENHRKQIQGDEPVKKF